MSIKKIDQSRYEISDSLNYEDINELIKEPSLRTVQISRPITFDSVEILNDKLF